MRFSELLRFIGDENSAIRHILLLTGLSQRVKIACKCESSLRNPGLSRADGATSEECSMKKIVSEISLDRRQAHLNRRA